MSGLLCPVQDGLRLNLRHILYHLQKVCQSLQWLESTINQQHRHSWPHQKGMSAVAAALPHLLVSNSTTLARN